MKPTPEQLEKAAHTWADTYKDVRYNLTHHGVNPEWQPEGIWCYYIFLVEELFQKPEDFALFDREAIVSQPFGRYHKTYEYHSIPDLEFHGGVTWYSKEPYLSPETGEDKYALKIGCDYNHSWDQDGRYWQRYEEVLRDCKRTIDLLVKQYPIRTRCSWSGKLDFPDKFYTAKNGKVIHEDYEKAASEFPGWVRAPEPS